jgi:hypothetical protein
MVATITLSISYNRSWVAEPALIIQNILFGNSPKSLSYSNVDPSVITVTDKLLCGSRYLSVK